MVDKLFLNPFLKNQNCTYLWINTLKFSTVCFNPMSSWGYQNILKLSCRPLVLPHLKLFKKAKKGLELVSLPDFLHEFWRKIFFLLHSIKWPNIIVWLLMLREILGNRCIVIVCWPGCDVICFEINLIFLIKLHFLLTKKSRQKFKYLENEKCF